MHSNLSMSPTISYAQNFKIALLLSIGLLCCSVTNSFVHQVHAYQKQPTALRVETGDGPMECLDNESDSDIAQRIMYNQLARKRESVRYQIVAAQSCEPLAQRMAEKYPDRFTFHPTKWEKFPDGTDNIELGGFSNPRNVISGEKVLFLASFHSNDTTLSQFSVMITLLQSFIDSLTVVLAFSPVGTMERVTKEGQVATAATYAHSK